jgi:hypothetical protein
VGTSINENMRLFAEQVGDHIEKLNELMPYGMGERVGGPIIERVCLATKLLGGSSKMLGFGTWSDVLVSFNTLLHHVQRTQRGWDEQLSQIVSELLETEQQVESEIESGVFERETVDGTFEGLLHEAEALLGETSEGDAPDDGSLSFKPIDARTVEADSPIDGGESSTLDRLIESLGAVKSTLDACVSDGDRRHGAVECLTSVMGECEFLFSVTRDIVGHLAGGGRAFMSRVSSAVVVDGVRDFFRIHAKLNGWRAELDIRGDDMFLDGDLAQAAAIILECCLIDGCTVHERRMGFDFRARVEIICRGLCLEARIFDNGSEYLGATGIESDDAAVFYKNLRRVRKLLGRWGGLLWVEPDSAGGERFRFTLPVSVSRGEHRIIESSGIRLAVPVQSVEALIAPETDGIVHRNGDRYIDHGGRRVPVLHIDELSGEPTDACGGDDRIAVIGLAEKRVGILISDVGTTVEAVSEQLTESDWTCLSTRRLHVGEQEYPILYTSRIMERLDYLKRLDRVPETPGSLPTTEEVDEIEKAVPRVLTGADRSLASR